MAQASRSDFGNHLKIKDGSKVAVIGGGPAGSFFSYFLLDIADRIDLDLKVDVYEPRNFFFPGPSGCNMCGGIISESLIQNLATEGINLPMEIVQRGLDTYTLHTKEGWAQIKTPLQEKRIASVHRGCGPMGLRETKWGSFDGFLQILAIEKGINLIQSRIKDIQMLDGYPQLFTNNNDALTYDLVVVAVGINSNLLNKFPALSFGYKAPQKVKTLIREFYVGEKTIASQLGNSMHIFLTEIKGLEFSAIIPKGDYVTLCMLGRDLGEDVLGQFTNTTFITSVLPDVVKQSINSCHCNPSINIRPAVHPYFDRLVFIGDSGVTRLYKDGIGAAYRTAKAAVNTVVFEGIAQVDFHKYYWPICRKINYDNWVGRIFFMINNINQKSSVTQATILRIIRYEQDNEDSRKYMSVIFWDLFTGSASYLSIFWLSLHPIFLIRFIKFFFIELLNVPNKRRRKSQFGYRYSGKKL